MLMLMLCITLARHRLQTDKTSVLNLKQRITLYISVQLSCLVNICEHFFFKQAMLLLH